ncbi:probable disease resistance protein At4g33300 [Cryptomeria japonica]|uniref:probable disease resistance protein At4g33300 n=1 Tax=Cryptomeria japonica TaxID=3369 RepID=UPI0027D9D55F|nr:probable disease resistance protein At4g33300 [Cryptomeria japonica]
MMQIFNCKTLSVRAAAQLKLLTPLIQEIYISDLKLPKDQRNPIFHQFYDTLVRGAELVKKCENISTLNLPLNHRYASQIFKLEKDINSFLGLIPAHILLDTRVLLAELKNNYPSEAADMSRVLNDSIFKQASLLTNDPSQNTMMLQQMVLDDLFDFTEIVGDSTIYNRDNGYGKFEILVGLEKSIGDLKGHLFNNEVSVVGVQCMGGGGKTTLALALCNDLQMKGERFSPQFGPCFPVVLSFHLKGTMGGGTMGGGGKTTLALALCNDLQMKGERFAPQFGPCSPVVLSFHLKGTMGGGGKTTLALALCNDLQFGPCFPVVLSFHLKGTIGGGGKTTLALALSNDLQMKDYFGNNIFLITVSQSPNLKGILEIMWEKIVRKKVPEFENVEDAHIQLQQQLLKQLKPALVILDDVWNRVSLENLLFQGPGYKTLITTRNSSIIPKGLSTQVYQLPLLGHKDALSLFCFWAFGQTSIPCTADANLVKEVQAECKGLPLALKVIASSLHGELPVVWEIAKNKLSKGELPVVWEIGKNKLSKGLLECLGTSVDRLDDVVKECFLDMGSFPEDTKICANALLDIWVYFRNLEWQDAFAILLELASRNLLNLTSNPGGTTISHGSVSELYFSQHKVMRDLALYLGCQGDIVHRKRLLMRRKENNLPESWALLCDREFDAQIVSIHTGPMGKNQWYGMNFPEAEALILLFTANEYYLPSFLKSMKKLKFLMVFNYGTKRATVKVQEPLSSLTQLRSVRLERVIAPALLKQSKVLQNLEKLSLSLCEGFQNTSTFNNNKLHDFKIDHCSDLEELPPSICNMPYAQMWSITNCYMVQNLSYDLGNLSSLRVLRLSALPGLKELPSSIGNLVGLEYLDISVCVGLKQLPEEIGQLKKLTELDMRECSRLKRLPRSVCGLTSLKHVICDEKIGKQWLKAKGIAIPELRVDIVELRFSLDWLVD